MRTRPSFVFQWEGLRANIARLPLVSSAHFSSATATASLYFLLAWYCSAPPPFLAELVVPAFFPVLHLAFRPTVACAAAAAFLA